MNRLEFMDYDTYNQVIGGSLADYLEFLKENPMVIDPNIQVKKNAQREEKRMEKPMEKEDYRYTIGVIVLETYLPRFEMKYGEFKYSNDNITNKEKYMELKNYFNNICEVNSIDELIEKGSYKNR